MQGLNDIEGRSTAFRRTLFPEPGLLGVTTEVSMTTRDLVHIALFAALTAALGLFPPLTLPGLGVPITAQSMGAMLAGAIAGSRRGGLALVLFLVLVAVGLPLLAGGRGGFGVFLGPTGGFLLSWPIAAFVIGLMFERSGANLTLVKSAVFLVLGGVVLVYLIGIPWVSLVARIDLGKAFLGSIAFVPGDLLKVALTVLIAHQMRRAFPAR